MYLYLKYNDNNKNMIKFLKYFLVIKDNFYI